MLLLLLTFAGADDHRWLESPKTERVETWRSERTAETAAWLEPDRLEWATQTLRDYTQASREAWRSPSDVRGEVILWRVSRQLPPTPEDDEDARFESWLELTDLQQQPLLVLPEIDGRQRTDPLCGLRLLPEGQGLVWGRREFNHKKPMDNPCEMVWTDLSSGETKPVAILHAPYGATNQLVDGRLLMADNYKKSATLGWLDLASGTYDITLRRNGDLYPFVANDGSITAIHGKGKRRRRYKLRYRDATAWTKIPRKTSAFISFKEDRIWAFSYREVLERGQRRLAYFSPNETNFWDWTQVHVDNDLARWMHVRLWQERMLVSELRGGVQQLYFATQDGHLQELVFEEPLLGVRSRATDGDRLVIWSNTPTSQRLHLMHADESVTELWQREQVEGHTVTEEIFATSEDGTQVPITVVYAKDLRPNGARPVWVHSYGGFRNATAANMSWAQIAFVESGGMVITVHARGGSERGSDWHSQGSGENLAKTFEDVDAGAQWAIDQGWTSRGKIVLSGASNGGLTATATALRDPTRYAGVVTVAGVHDMLRGYTYGPWWGREYGNPRYGKSRARLAAISPAAAEPSEPLPPTFVVTGLGDPTVDPVHAYKLVEQWRNLSGGPILLEELPWPTHLGHLPKKKREQGIRILEEQGEFAYIDSQARELAFITQALDMSFPRGE